MNNYSNSNVKILFIAPRFHTNQIPIISTLMDKNIEVDFIVSRVEFVESHKLINPKVLIQSNISKYISKVFRKNQGNTPLFFPNLIKYFIMLKKIKATYVIIRDPQTLLSIFSAIICYTLRYRIIFYSQIMLKRKISLIKRYIIYFFIIIFDAVWYSPIVDYNGLEKKIRNVHYIPFIVDYNFVEKKYEENIKIITIAKYKEKRKNIDLLINAIKVLNNKNIYLDIYGECIGKFAENNFNKLNKIIKDLMLEENIKLFKNVNHDIMIKQYSKYNLFILPAINEYASISVLEAIASGVPAICTDTCGTKSYISHGYNGYIIKSNNINSIIDIINKYVHDYSVLKIPFYENCKQYYYKNISREKFFNLFRDMIYRKWNNYI